MQFATAAALFAVLATAGATDAPQPYFQVFNFIAACTSKTGLCTYEFDLFQPGEIGGELSPGKHCERTLNSEGGSGILPAVTDGTCKETGRTWTITKGVDGSLNVTAVTQVSPLSYGGGSHTINIHELIFEGDPPAQKYIGPPSFGLYPQHS